MKAEIQAAIQNAWTEALGDVRGESGVRPRETAAVSGTETALGNTRGSMVHSLDEAFPGMDRSGALFGRGFEWGGETAVPVERDSHPLAPVCRYELTPSGKVLYGYLYRQTGTEIISSLSPDKLNDEIGKIDPYPGHSEFLFETRAGKRLFDIIVQQFARKDRVSDASVRRLKALVRTHFCANGFSFDATAEFTMTPSSCRDKNGKLHPAFTCHTSDAQGSVETEIYNGGSKTSVDVDRAWNDSAAGARETLSSVPGFLELERKLIRAVAESTSGSFTTEYGGYVVTAIKGVDRCVVVLDSSTFITPHLHAGKFEGKPVVSFDTRPSETFAVRSNGTLVGPLPESVFVSEYTNIERVEDRNGIPHFRIRGIAGNVNLPSGETGIDRSGLS